MWSAFSPHLIQQATILKLRKSVWPSVFKYTELFSLEENECFYNNNWTLMFLMLLSYLDGSGLFLSELCLCFVVFKCILNRVNLNQANTSHLIKCTMKCFNSHVVNFSFASHQKKLKKSGLAMQISDSFVRSSHSIRVEQKHLFIQNSYSHNLACFNYFCAWSCQNGFGVVITTRALRFTFFFFSPNLVLSNSNFSYLSLHFMQFGKWSSWLPLFVYRICHWIVCAGIMLQEVPYIQIVLLRLRCVKSLLTHWTSQIHFFVEAYTSVSMHNTNGWAGASLVSGW